MQDSFRLSQARSRDLPLENRQAAKPVVCRPANSTGRKLTGRSRFKRLELTRRSQQLSFFRLFNEACGDLGMQLLSH